jgi:HSP20 family molecular chaperone IbpA
MSLIRWDPFRGFNTAISTTAWNPSVDILETDNDVVVKAELPGMDPKSIDVRLENNVLLLKGDRHFEKETKEENYHRIEREYGSFSRAFFTADGSQGGEDHRIVQGRYSENRLAQKGGSEAKDNQD